MAGGRADREPALVVRTDASHVLRRSLGLSAPDRISMVRCCFGWWQVLGSPRRPQIGHVPVQRAMTNRELVDWNVSKVEISQPTVLHQ